MLKRHYKLIFHACFNLISNSSKPSIFGGQHQNVTILANQNKHRLGTNKIEIRDTCCWHIHSSQGLEKLRVGKYVFENFYVKRFESEEC